ESWCRNRPVIEGVYLLFSDHRYCSPAVSEKSGAPSDTRWINGRSSGLTAPDRPLLRLRSWYQGPPAISKKLSLCSPREDPDKRRPYLHWPSSGKNNHVPT